MNKIYQFRLNNLVFSLAVLVLFSSCSSFNLWKDEKVSKEEYEKLLVKYKALVEKNTPSQPTAKSLKVHSNPILESKQVEDFRKSLISSESNVVSKNSKNYHSKRVRKDIGLLYQAYSMFNQKKFGDVIIILKELEDSQVFQIRAQARFLLGKTMYEQGEYDVAMQIFEEIVLKMRGTVFGLLSLEKLISCTDKVGLMQKKKYFSQLYSRFQN